MECLFIVLPERVNSKDHVPKTPSSIPTSSNTLSAHLPLAESPSNTDNGFIGRKVPRIPGVPQLTPELNGAASSLFLFWVLIFVRQSEINVTVI